MKFTASENKNITLALISTVLSRIVILMSGLALSILLTRFLGAADAGEFFIVISIMSGCVLLLRGGIQDPLTRILSVDVGQGNSTRVYSTYIWTIRYSALMGVLSGVLLIAIGSPLASILFEQSFVASDLRIAAFAIPAMTLIWLTSSFLKAMNKPALSLIFDFNGVAFICLPGLFLLVYLEFFSLHSALWLVVFSSYLLAGLGAPTVISGVKVGALKENSGEKESRRESFRWKDISRFSSPMLLASLSAYVFATLPVVLIGVAADTFAAGLFVISHKLSRVVIVANSIALSVYAPRFAKSYAAKNTKELKLDVLRAGILAAALAAGPFLVFMFFPREVLSIFGTDLASAVPLLRILAFGSFVEVAFGPVGMALIMMEKEFSVRNIMVFTAVLLLACVVLWWDNPDPTTFSILLVSVSTLSKALMLTKFLLVAKKGGSQCA